MLTRPTSSARRAGALALLLTAAAGAHVAPASAAARAASETRPAPVVSATVACTAPGAGLEFGGATVSLDVRAGWLPKDDVFVVVPVIDATGLDAGERVSAGRRGTVTVVLPADGTALTPASTVEVRLGGRVLQRIPVAPGCGVLDPAPERGPVLTAVGGVGTVAVEVLNGSSVFDEIGVTVTRVGGTSGPTQFLPLEPGETGSTGFSGLAAGQYVVEAFGYNTFREVESEPITVS